MCAVCSCHCCQLTQITCYTLSRISLPDQQASQPASQPASLLSEGLQGAVLRGMHHVVHNATGLTKGLLVVDQVLEDLEP